MTHRALFTLTIAALLVAVAAARTFVSTPPVSAFGARQIPTSSWERWERMGAEQRWALVREFQEIERREDGAEILAAARRFQQLSPEEQQRCRQLRALCTRAIAEMPASERRWMLQLPPGARALRVYRILKEEGQDALTGFRRTPRDAVREAGRP